MNLYKFVSLGVFACVCFLGGFLLGDWAAYDEKLIKEIRHSNSQHYEYSNKAMDLVYSTEELNSLLKVRKNGNLDEHVKILHEHLARKVDRFEKDIEKYPFKEKYFIFSTSIERAKAVLKKGNT